jgi:hypothetical protein
MLDERAWLNGFATLVMDAYQHSICDIQVYQMTQVGWEFRGLLVVHVER